MKKTTLLLSFLSIIILSCNKIDTKDEIFTIISPVEVTDWDPEYAAGVVRNIYIEEFTGHRCIYCPAGANELKAIMEEDPTVIATAIHCSSLANPLSNPLFSNNYKTPMGDIIYDYFNIKGLPKATINRMKIGAEWGIIPSQWSSKIAGVDRSNITAGIQLECTVDEVSQEIEAKVAVTIIKEIPNRVQICVILQQDSIISGQMFPSGQIDDAYVHTHMLRAGFNGHFGTKLTPNGFVSARKKYSTSFVLSYKNSFPYSNTPLEIKNSSVVAYLIDIETKEILQVECVPLMPSR